MSESSQATAFRALHAVGRILVLPNAWDAGSARVIEACGAEAIATTSAGVAWSCGYPDGNAVPPRVLADAVARIARAITVPLTVDAEGGYASEPARAAEHVRALVDAGAVGINIEDGDDPPDALCAKISAVRNAARQAGVDLFINARTDVFLHALVPPAERVGETLARARRYADAGCDGLFVPAAVDPDDLRALVAGTTLPVNVMMLPKLAPSSELATLGIRRVSAGGAIAQAVHALTRRAAIEILTAGSYRETFAASVPYPELNQLFTR